MRCEARRGGQGHVVEFAAVEPAVDGVGPPGVRADGGLNTIAYDLLHGTLTHSPADVYADQWLARTERYSYSLREDSIRGPADQVLSLLWWVNEDPLQKLVDEDERRMARRSDWRDD